MPLELEPDGVVGRITDPIGNVVAGGTVYLVPAADVAALDTMEIDLSLSPTDVAALGIDEPLEDLIDTQGSTYTQGTVDADGIYRIPTVPEGTYFIVWVPDPGDAEHYPGGSNCRVAFESRTFVGAQHDLEVSGRQSPDATFVGSSTCMGCHGRHRIERTAHFNGLQVPGRRGYFQDTTPWPAFDDPLAQFRAGTVLYYYACDAAASGPSKCRVSDTPPGGSETVSFEVQLRHDASVGRGQPGEYYVNLVNRRGPGTARYDVDLTYGGTVYKQRYLTRLVNPGGAFGTYLLPMQFNYRGDASYPDPDDWPWRDYHSERWYDHAAGTLREPTPAQTFEQNCAGCHFTGLQLAGNDTDGWTARAVGDPLGAYDFDGDGRNEEINIGCESCHGPGSEHVESGLRHDHIVQPGLLTPGRETQICGVCHSRPQGIGAGGTEAPLSADLRMPLPGLRRAEFAVEHTQRVDGDASAFWDSGDSRKHHQQYSDFIRSAMYRNGEELMTCSSCHDPHGSDTYEHQLYFNPDENAGCTSCHSATEFTSIHDHVQNQTGNRHDGVEDVEFRCIRCHMVRTATSGARIPGLIDAVPPPRIEYFSGDIRAHRFGDVRLRDYALQQPAAVTLSCAPCHAGWLPNR